MSTSHAIYLDARRLPDAQWLAASASALEPTFAFAASYDFSGDSGWCPCRLGGVECGFEWELQSVEDLPIELLPRRFSHIASVAFRSSDVDAICAILIAANLAAITGGVLATADGLYVDPDGALPWASAQIRAIRKRRKPRSKPKSAASAEETLAVWLAGLPPAEGLVRSLPDDPLVGIRFGRDLVLKMRRWSVTTPSGTFSTAALPPSLSTADVAALDAAVGQLEAMLRAGPAREASFDARSFTLRFAYHVGTLTVSAQADAYPDPLAAATKARDRWELSDPKTCIHPDVDERMLLRR